MGRKNENEKTAFEVILGENINHYKELMTKASYVGINDETKRPNVEEIKELFNYISKIKSALNSNDPKIVLNGLPKLPLEDSLKNEAYIVTYGLPTIPLQKYKNFLEHEDIIIQRLKEGYYPKE